MQNDILFDNIYIGHSVEDAEKLRSETFDIKHAIEKAEEDASKPPPPKDEPKGPLDINFTEDPVRFVREKLDLFWDVAKNDPVQAVKFFPDVAGGIGAVAVAILLVRRLKKLIPAVQRGRRPSRDTGRGGVRIREVE